MKKTSLLLAASLFATPAFAQSDDCAGAGPLVDGTPTAFDTSAATVGGPTWPCAAGGGPDIWYTFTTTQLADVEVSTCNNATYDTAVEIFSGDCNNLVPVTCNDDGGGCTGFTSLATANGIPANTQLFIRIGGFNGATGSGTVTLTESMAFDCATAPDDNFEDNDTCQTAVTLMPGTQTGLFCSLSDGDYYSIALGANDILDFTIIDTINEDLDLRLYDASCNLIQDFNTDGLSYAAGGVAQTVVVEVYVDPGFAGIGCLNYDLTASVAVDPCSVLMPDAFEDNDDCNGAAPLTDGTYPGLTVFDADNDYFAVTVADGGTLDATILFIDANGDVDLYLWDPLVACDTNVAGAGTGTGALAVGFSASDDETITYTNNTGAAQNLILEVDMFTAGGCNTYDLQMTGGGVVAGPIGTNYCTAVANSTMAIGTMGAFGFTSVAANDVTLSASSLPANQFGIFITSVTQGFVPGAGGTSNGNLCLGGQINRFVGPGQIVNSGATGEISLVLDLANFPNGGGITQVMAGESRNFQAWHRDVVGQGSNFTDGIQIGFTN